MKEKGFKKEILYAAVIIGATTLAFQGLTQAAAAAEYKKTNVIPTKYADYTNVTSKASQENLPEGYKKANYAVGTINLPYYKNKKPTEKDMTKEDAAELAAQYLYQIYGVNLEGQTLETGYGPATDTISRPTWTVDIKMKNQDYHDGYRVDDYEVIIDSVTGELFNIGMDRTLKAKVNAVPDASIDESKFEAAAKKLAEKYNIVHSRIKSINCTGQGASFPSNVIEAYGDPDISFEVHGENDEIALITISRYDKVLMGISYNAEYKASLENDQKHEKELQEKIEKNKKSVSPADKNEIPSLKSVQ